MNGELTQIEAPDWLLRLFKSIDELDFSEGSGFEIFADDIVMQFGPETLNGIEAVRAFFIKLDAPFITKHIVDKAFQIGRTFMMQGKASLRKKDDLTGNTFQVSPLFNLLWFDENGKVIRYVVDFPPDAAEASGLTN